MSGPAIGHCSLVRLVVLGPDTACVIHFDKAFSERTGEEFIRGLARDCRKIQSLSVGRAFAFGRGRSGNVALLNALGKELNFAVHALAEVSLDGQPVSSTRVRAAVRAGRFAQAAQMLGRPYTLCGRIIKGSGVGRQMGVPTANLDLAGLLTPPSGVYAARAFVVAGAIPPLSTLVSGPRWLPPRLRADARSSDGHRPPTLPLRL